LRVLEGHTHRVRSVAWSPDGTQLASGSTDHTARVWDATSGQALRALEGHTGSVFSVAWSPDGTRLASGSYDGTVRVWGVSSVATAATVATEQSTAVQIQPCTVSTTRSDVVVRVGPGPDRGRFRTLPGNQQIVVLGQAIDGANALWWKID